MEIVIKKRINFDFLGEDYKEAYIVLRAMPINEYESMQEEAKSVADDNNSSLKLIIKLVKSKFIEGKFPNAEGKLEEFNKEDLDKFNFETVNECFTQLIGGKVDPKV